MKTSIFLGLCFLLLGAWAKFSTSILGYGSQGLRVGGTSANPIRNVPGLPIEERSWFLKSCLPLPQAWEFLPIFLLLALCLTKGLKKLWLSILLVVLAAPYLSPSKAATDFDAVLSTSENEYEPCITFSNDGGYFISARSNACGWCLWLVKLDSDGVKVWETFQSPCSSLFPQSIDTTTDGGCVVTGNSICNSVSGNFVMRLHSNGTLNWFSEITTDAYAEYIQVDKYGYYTIVGYLSGNLYMARIDYDGGLYWWNTTSLSGVAKLFSIAQLSDDRIAGIGEWSSTSTQCLIYIMDLEGTQSSWFEYGGSGTERCHGITQVSDGNIIIAGTTSSGTFGSYDGLLVKMSTEGITIWDKVYGASSYDDFLRVKTFSDGTLGVGGKKYGISDFWLLNVKHTDGSVLRELSLGPSVSKTIYDMNVHPTEKIAAFVGVTSYDVCVAVKVFGCLAGTYLDTSTNTCKECQPGTYQDLHEQSDCKQCPLGTYQNLAGQLECTNCPLGQYQDTQGQPTCKPCEAGYFQNVEGQDSCQKCPVGEAQSQTGQSACVKCLAGQYQDAQGQTTCKDCSAGEFQSAQGQVSCQACPVGTYQDTTGAADCKSCSTGHYQSSTGQTMCHPCGIGYFQGEEGQTSCQLCPLGMYASTSGSSECTPCSVGEYQNLVGQGSCIPCAVGTHQPNIGMTQCIECDPGTYQTEEGKNSCDACLAGYYQDLTGQTSCKLCQVGTYQSEPGKSSCIECEPGKYQDNEGQTSCILCPLGTYQDISSQTSCKSCSVGHYQDVQGQASCKPCLAGYVQAMTGKDSCSACAIGAYQPNEGQSQCLECPPGSFQNEAGKGSCYSCPPGSYQDLAGQTSCKVCQAGTYQSESGKTSCVQCELGKYQDSEGQSSCILCPVGTYQDTLSQASCKDCSIGHYQDIEGQTSCKSCAPGSFQSTVKQARCEPCPAGSYQAESGKDQCVLCGIGTVQPDLGMSSCDDCEPGYFQDEEGKAVCKVCPAGTYQDISGQTSCKECPPGSNQPNTGATTCVTCGFDWHPSVSKETCLYKGIFATEAEFTSHEFSSACYNASSLLKPFSTSCRDVYRSICCQGSTPLSNMNCNFALETAGTLLQNKYCSACMFMDPYACPTNGLCWDNTAWTSNEISPYPANYSVECLEAISSYCGEKFMTDSADPECAPFLSNCFAKVKSSSYGSKWNRFRIEFTNKIPLSFPNCNELFNSTANPIFKTGSISCTRLSDTSIEVDVSDLSQPILNYSFADKVMKDACGIYLPSNPIENVAVPTLEVVFIGWNSTDKCMGLTIRSTIEVFFVWVDNY